MCDHTYTYIMYCDVSKCFDTYSGVLYTPSFKQANTAPDCCRCCSVSLVVWKATTLKKAEVWVEMVTEGRRRFMAVWRKKEVNAVRHRQEERKATRLGKSLSHTEA